MRTQARQKLENAYKRRDNLSGWRGQFTQEAMTDIALLPRR
jgi:hypothetical protein